MEQTKSTTRVVPSHAAAARPEHRAAEDALNTERIEWIAKTGFVTINTCDTVMGGAPFVEITDASGKVLGIGRRLVDALDDARGA